MENARQLVLAALFFLLFFTVVSNSLNASDCSDAVTQFNAAFQHYTELLQAGKTPDDPAVVSAKASYEQASAQRDAACGSNKITLCGDGKCEGKEDKVNCPEDCGAPEPSPTEAPTETPEPTLEQTALPTREPTRTPSASIALSPSPASSCSNGVQDDYETGVDCGGDCPPCNYVSSVSPKTVTMNADGKSVQEFVFSISLNGKPVQGLTYLLVARQNAEIFSYPPGSLSTETITTDADGKARFSYTAPALPDAVFKNARVDITVSGTSGDVARVHLKDPRPLVTVKLDKRSLLEGDEMNFVDVAIDDEGSKEWSINAQTSIGTLIPTGRSGEFHTLVDKTTSPEYHFNWKPPEGAVELIDALGVYEGERRGDWNDYKSELKDSTVELATGILSDVAEEKIGKKVEEKLKSTKTGEAYGDLKEAYENFGEWQEEVDSYLEQLESWKGNVEQMQRDVREIKSSTTAYEKFLRSLSFGVELLQTYAGTKAFITDKLDKEEEVEEIGLGAKTKKRFKEFVEAVEEGTLAYGADSLQTALRFLASLEREASLDTVSIPVRIVVEVTDEDGFSTKKSAVFQYVYHVAPGAATHSAPLILSFASSTPIDVLKQYYAADKKEDVNALMSLTDFSHVAPSERESFKADARKTLEVLNRVFDTVSYELSGERVLENSNSTDAFVFYHLNATLKDASGKTVEINSDYVAVMHKTEGEWKIVFVQPKAAFEQVIALREAAVAAGASIKKAVVGREESGVATSATPTPAASPFIGGDFDFDFDFGDFGGSTFLIILVVIILALIGAFYVIKKVLFNKFVIGALLLLALLVIILLFGFGGGGGGGGNETTTVAPLLPSLHPTFAHEGSVEPTVQASVSSPSDVASKAELTRQATQAYADYVAAYNRLTDLMSRGQGDSPEAQQAYADYKAAKARYEELAARLKNLD